MIAAWCAALAVVLLWGSILSACHDLGSRPGWIFGFLLAAIAGRAASLGMRRNTGDSKSDAGIGAAVRSHPALLFLGTGVAAVIAAGAVTAFGAAPSNWDSLTYHLARVGYYLQQGSLADFDANFFCQEQQARGVSIVQSALIAVCRGSDLMVGVPQLLGYVMCLASLYALARELGRSTAASLAAAATFGLLTIAAMEAPTPQNDLVLASLIGAGLLGTVAYILHGRPGALFLGAGGFALATAVKASALTCGPAIMIVIAAASWSAPAPRFAAVRRAGILTAATAAAILVFALPAGYWKNWQRFGNPVGGPEMFELHTHLGADEHSRGYIGAVNMVRFTGDLCTLDGLPESWGGNLGTALKRQIGTAFKAIGLDAESPRGTRAPFSWSRPRSSDENLSYFGWVGAVLLIPGCLGALFVRRRDSLTFAFALAFGVFLVGQSLAGPYDPWRGRPFLYGALFAAPAAAWLFDASNRAVRRAAWGAAVIGSVAIVPALLYRSPNPLVSRPGAPSLVSLNRLQQMALHHPCYPALSAFDRLVPLDATVIVALPLNEYEYPLFGPKISRHLIPYRRALRDPKLNSSAGYLLYDRRLGLPTKSTDINLGYFWSLRRL